jgi:hypothetical protein
MPFQTALYPSVVGVGSGTSPGMPIVIDTKWRSPEPRDPEGGMRVTTYEGTVEDGQVKLPEAVRLPERARVFVVVPGVEEGPEFHVGSPRLARSWQAADFSKEVAEEPRDAGLR